MAWRLQRTRQAVLPGKCAQGLCVTSVQYCADVEASAPKNETRDAGWKPCKGAKGVWRHLEGVTSRFPLQLWGFPRVSKGFLRVSDRRLKQCHKMRCGLAWEGCVMQRRRKRSTRGSGAYMNQVQRFSRGISGLVVEYIVTIWPGFDSPLMHIVLMSRWERVRWRGEGGTRSRDWQSHDCLDWNAADLQILQKTLWPSG